MFRRFEHHDFDLLANTGVGWSNMMHSVFSLQISDGSDPMFASVLPTNAAADTREPSSKHPFARSQSIASLQVLDMPHHLHDLRSFGDPVS